MNAKDTEMSDAEVKQELAKYDIPEVYVSDEVIADMTKQMGNIISVVRKAQAEISVKAGINYVLSRAVTDGCLCNDLNGVHGIHMSDDLYADIKAEGK